MITETKPRTECTPPRSGYTSKEAAHQLVDTECLACGGIKRSYVALCSGCRACLTPALRRAIDVADGEALSLALLVAREARGLPADFGEVGAEEARLRAIDDHATVGTHCDGGDL